eukprot:TRINITY_DN48959_c0_g1_i1.p1 TRINITY_DN48959_c0_g1~~TRINITY_DN48959_c0_g1_i1.p1  ORF type:complete len:282 (+),score=53.12 TRINITY_DN48959_c0_g1_i1:35-847(+)
MPTSGSPGILKECKRRPRGVTIADFSCAQVIPVTPSPKENALLHTRERLRVASRLMRTKFDSDEVNAQQARMRAFNPQRAVFHDAGRGWLTLDEIADFEEREEQHALPSPPSSSLKGHEQVVRFSDGVDIEQYDFIETEQCELGSAHELCLITFVSRVRQADNFSHEFNEREALDIASRLREEILVQLAVEGASSCDGSAETMHHETWVSLELLADRNVDESRDLPDDGKCRKKAAKHCFSILDASCMPKHNRNRSEGKRWQDQVRHAAG